MLKKSIINGFPAEIRLILTQNTRSKTRIGNAICRRTFKSKNISRFSDTMLSGHLGGGGVDVIKIDFIFIPCLSSTLTAGHVYVSQFIDKHNLDK